MAFSSLGDEWASISIICGVKRGRTVPESCLFSLVLSVPLKLWPTSGKKTGKQQGRRCGPKNKPPPLPNEHSLKTCSYPSHFLNSRGVFLRPLICCWLLECRVISSVTCSDSGARPRWVHRKKFDLLMRPLPSTSQLKCDGLLEGRFHWMNRECHVKNLMQLKIKQKKREDHSN